MPHRMKGLLGSLMTVLFPALPLIAGFGLAPPVYAQVNGTVHQYLTRDEALSEVFPKCEKYLVESVSLDSTAAKEAETELHVDFATTDFNVTLCFDSAGAFIGYAVITEEVGKYRPITFIVGVTTSLAVEKVAIMVYREDRGGEVRTPRFLYQFRGKTAEDPIRSNRDIINVSGATLSVRAISNGVRKVLYVIARRYGGDPPASTFQVERKRLARKSNG